MKYMYFCVFIVSLILSSCADNSMLWSCEIAESIIEKDQFYRQKHANIISPYFFLLDSLLKEQGIADGIDNLSSVDDALRSDTRAEVQLLLSQRAEPKQETLDSIWNLQGLLDKENTLQLIDVVAEIGLDSFANMDFECGREAFIAFVHCPDELKLSVKNLVDPALKAIDANQYDHIMWHLNGRQQR